MDLVPPPVVIVDPLATAVCPFPRGLREPLDVAQSTNTGAAKVAWVALQ